MLSKALKVRNHLQQLHRTKYFHPEFLKLFQLNSKTERSISSGRQATALNKEGFQKRNAISRLSTNVLMCWIFTCYNSESPRRLLKILVFKYIPNQLNQISQGKTQASVIFTYPPERPSVQKTWKASVLLYSFFNTLF